MTLRIRAYSAQDSETLFSIYVDAVRNGTRDHYTRAQRHAWAPETTPPEGWAARLAGLDTLVALLNGDPAGFMATSAGGYVDLAFVRPGLARRGVGQALYEAMLPRARARALPRLTTHASRAARPLFARNGWKVDASERVDRHGETLERFAMSLALSLPG